MQNCNTENFHPFLDLYFLREKYVQNFFFEVREYYTFYGRVRPPDQESAGPPRIDVSVQNSAAPKVPVQPYTKNTRENFHFPNKAKLYII